MPLEYEMAIVVGTDDIDRLGHVNNIVYLRWVQDIAVAHWSAAASPEHQAQILWLALRHEIDYKSPAVLGDEVLVRTRLGGAEGLRYERFTEMFRQADRKLLAKARTLWCPIDAQTKRPCRVPEEIQREFSVKAKE